MSDAERTALLLYHADEIKKLLKAKPVETPVVINESKQQVRANRLSKFTTKR